MYVLCYFKNVHKHELNLFIEFKHFRSRSPQLYQKILLQMILKQQSIKHAPITIKIRRTQN